MVAPRKIALVVDSLDNRADSVVADCLFQAEIFATKTGPAAEVALFTASGREPLPGCRPVEALAAFIGDGRDCLTVYHWRDGWPGFDDRFLALPGRKVVRWHNNTPPWFFAPYSLDATARTLRGFAEIRRLAARDTVEIWVNSRFSAGQMMQLGADPARLRVVYPTSPVLQHMPARPERTALAAPAEAGGDAIRLLFVGRFVPHKGHKHLVAAAACLRLLTERRIELHIVGSINSAMPGYAAEVKALAAETGVGLIDHGAVEPAALEALYRRADLFLGLSEHEGFGLPVLEAMCFGLPVVGLATTAAGEVLAGHPLAVTSADHAESARRIAAALQPSVRAAVTAWQSQHLLPRFNGAIAEMQLLAASLEAANGPEILPAPVESAPRELVAATLADLPPLPLPPGLAQLLRQIPADLPGRLVTLHDLDSFDSLLQRVDRVEGDLYRSVWRHGFPSKRRWSSRALRALRRAILSLNFGLVASVERSRRQTDERLDRLTREVEALRAQTGLLLERLDGAAPSGNAERPRPAAGDRSGIRQAFPAE